MPLKASMRELRGVPMEARQSRTSLADSTCLLKLFHSDWSVPQAQQALSTWMTLAMLLAGIQRTLLSYFRSADNSTSLIDGIGWAGLCLEVYGALLASVAIVSSISLSASMSGRSSKSITQFHSGFFECLGFKGPQATAILDHLTLACGCIVITGAVCELISLTAYITISQKSPVSYTVAVTLVACGLVTLSAGAWGYLNGSKTQSNVDDTECEDGCVPLLSTTPSLFLTSAGIDNDRHILGRNAFATSPHCYK